VLGFVELLFGNGHFYVLIIIDNTIALYFSLYSTKVKYFFQATLMHIPFINFNPVSRVKFFIKETIHKCIVRQSTYNFAFYYNI